MFRRIVRRATAAWSRIFRRKEEEVEEEEEEVRTYSNANEYEYMTTLDKISSIKEKFDDVMVIESMWRGESLVNRLKHEQMVSCLYQYPFYFFR